MTRCVTALWNGSPAGLFLDLGAFLGIYACQVAASNQTSGRIVAVESNPAYCRSIEMSVRLNGFSNVEVINAVASNDIHPVIVRDNTVTTSDEAHGNAHTTTIDRLCQERSLAPTLVKVDVHGTEGIVLQGMREILRQHVRFLLLESHSYRYLDRYSPGVTREEILELLIEAGFALFHVAGHRLHADDKQRACVRNGELAYRPIPPESPRQALFDRMDELFILAAKDPAELAACLGPPSDDPLWY
ncbi:MAG: FkbM family methyltransferase [Gammaproteobacteria bacterium]|nr:FkbM family methyltransferase [Gammaproteobacteria bacterium]